MLRSFDYPGAEETAPDAWRRRRHFFDPLVAVIDRALYVAIVGLALCLILIVFE